MRTIFDANINAHARMKQGRILARSLSGFRYGPGIPVWVQSGAEQSGPCHFDDSLPPADLPAAGCGFAPAGTGDPEPSFTV
jgi:hypothetical protein